MNQTRSSQPPVSPGSLAGRYAINRFTGFGGTDESTRQQKLLEAQAAQAAQEALVPPPPNPVITRLREDVDRLLEEVAEKPGLRTAAGPALAAAPGPALIHPVPIISRTMEAWALSWRMRALTDLDERVAEMKQVYVIHRGDSHRHLLFLDNQGRHILAVQPQEPSAELRYSKLAQGTELNDLYGPFARLSDTPRG